MADYTKELMYEKWSEIVMKCNTSGMSKVAWCKENNINLKSFYYWQHKLRTEMMQAKITESAADIVHITLWDETLKNTETDKIIIRKCGIEIELPAIDLSIESVIRGLILC